MKEKVILTIGIPVYNGERFLKQTLESIIEALKISENSDRENRIEILISDNCSTDNTEKIIKNYIDSGKIAINYYKNDKNYKYDGNIDLVVERSSGKYVWLLGCGEIVKKDALKIITTKLKKDTYDTVLLNFDIFSEKINSIEDTNAYNSKDDVIMNSKNEIFKKFGGPALAVSSNIVLKSAWESISNTQLNEIGWCHIERINDIILAGENDKTLFISDICFTLYREIDGWWTGKSVYINFIIYCRIVQGLKARFNDKNTFKKIERRCYPISLLNSIFISKKMDIKFSFDILKMTINVFYNKISFWIFIFPLMLLPNFLFKIRIFNNCVLLVKENILSLRRRIKDV